MKKKKSITTIASTKKVGKNAKAIGSFIVEHKTPILIVGGAVLGWVLVKQLRKGVTGLLDPKFEHVNIDVSVDTTKATITRNQAQKLAQQLLDAFNGAFPLYGTDEETVKDVFLRLKNAEDFKLVYKAFGMKNYNGFNSPPTGIFRHIDNYEPRDLVYWLKSELSKSDGEVYTIVKERLESANWTF